MLKSFIIIPCYNPTKKLVAVITKIQKRFKGIIILIDDGNFIKNKKYIYSIYKRKNLKIISHKSNMGKGAVAKINTLTKKEKNISKKVAILLKKNNIYFAGIDFVQGQLIGDINVTSPTGLATYYNLTGINLAQYFWDNI